MTCSGGSTSIFVDQKEYQDLSGWKGIALEKLLSNLQSSVGDEVRIYTVASTKLDIDAMAVRHLGSGPNLEGGRATLCTCKHSMRQSHTLEGWKGKWVLGLTSRAANKGFGGIHYLFYMMKVDQAFDSHHALYSYLRKVDGEALRIKNAVGNPLGDIFQPKRPCADLLDPKMYVPPHKDHSHGSSPNDQWCQDVVYKGKCAPLLLADSGNTYVWPRPMIRFKLNRGVGNMRLTIGEDLFSVLETHEYTR